jgi:hypothetical protein
MPGAPGGAQEGVDLPVSQRKQALAPGVPVAKAVDLVWALSGAEVYGMLVVERGWSPDEYGEWLATALAASLPLHPAPAG